ncbi:MAG: hypothetical protein LBJ00_08185 [Planctomycetaceae bacterium]|jgi:hypothetical protein|nr:hypothetical protein [Planctomycetaceae bacterium]
MTALIGILILGGIFLMQIVFDILLNGNKPLPKYHIDDDDFYRNDRNHTWM